MRYNRQFIFNPFQEVCSLVWDGNGFCAFIDPGCEDSEKEELTSFVKTEGLTPVCIMLTHGHFDHIYGLAGLVREYGIPVYMDTKEFFSFEKTNPHVCSNYVLPLPELLPPEAFTPQ